MVAGALVFGLVAVSAIALISAFPPVLLFGALFGLAVAAEMRTPVREFQADEHNQREEKKFDAIQENQNYLDEEASMEARMEADKEADKEDGIETDDSVQLPLAPTAPLPSLQLPQQPQRPQQPQQQQQQQPHTTIPLRLSHPS